MNKWKSFFTLIFLFFLFHRKLHDEIFTKSDFTHVEFEIRNNFASLFINIAENYHVNV